MKRRTFYDLLEGEAPGEPEPFSRLDTARLKVYVDELKAELYQANRELWRRTAVRLVALPPNWSTPPHWVGDDDLAIEEYQERLADFVENALRARDCAPNKQWPWSEVWGPQGRLGKNPAHEIRQTLEWARERIEGERLG